MSRFRVTDAPIGGVRLIERMPIADERGFFVRLFCAEELRVAGWDKPVVQINHTRTNRRGTVRGLHFQFPPHSENKLVTCLAGAVWDVVVDLRARSPSFLNWFAAELSADNGHALMIPEGCAHGFQTLSDDCELLYCHSAPYAPAAEGVINVFDSRLGIRWPQPVTFQSERDRAAKDLGLDFRGIET